MSVPKRQPQSSRTESPGPLGAVLLRPLGVEGVYARTGLFEEVVERLDAFISHRRDSRAEVLRFPPVMNREHLERGGYLESFPNLLGCVCSLHGTEAQIRAALETRTGGGDWTSSLVAADLVLTPAACYPLYPLVASSGRLPQGGLQFDIAADCFRREPSPLPSRLQSFRMREFVRIGSPQEIRVFRDQWMRCAVDLARELALPCRLEVASDPFFGRTGQAMAVSQIQQSLKFELLVEYRPTAEPMACMSFNDHRDHFGRIWCLAQSAGDVAHTGCVAFGMDRLAVALFSIHGVDLAQWPASVRRALQM